MIVNGKTMKAYGNFSETGGMTEEQAAQIEKLNDAVFRMEESDGINKFNPYTATQETVLDAKRWVSDLIPCKVGDMIWFYRNGITSSGQLGAIRDSAGIILVDASGAIAVSSNASFGSYTVPNHPQAPNLIGVRIYPRWLEPVEDYGIEDFKNVMVTIATEQITTFYPWSESNEVNRIEKLEEQFANIESSRNLADKKVLVIGDSISTGNTSTGINYGNYEKWVDKLIKQGFFSADNVTNDSIHATGFVASLSGDGTDCFLPRLQAVTNPGEYDLVILFGGINDFIKCQTVNMEFSEFTAAVDAFFEYLTGTFTNARVCVFSPLRIAYNSTNLNGHTQQEYMEHIMNVAKSYCLPVLNLSEESGFYPWIPAFKNRWTFTGWAGGDGTTGDGVHPSEEWQETRLAPMIKAFLKGLIE